MIWPHSRPVFLYVLACPTKDELEELTDKEREGSLPDDRNYLESAINAGLVPEVELIHNGPLAGLGNINREIERQATTMATALPLLLYRFRTTPPEG